MKSLRNKKSKRWTRRKATREGRSLEQHLVSYQGVSLEVSPEERRRFDSHGGFAWQEVSNSTDGLKRCKGHQKVSWEFHTDLG